MSLESVEEIQGLYGPFSVSERLIQKIWNNQEFSTDSLRTQMGDTLTVLDPGKWNTNEGPDFLGARLEIKGQEVFGDVEIHFYAQDWLAHGHQADEHFDRVVLHVLLFAPDDSNSGVVKSNGAEPETLVLLPYLERDLESYALDAALLELESQDAADWVLEFHETPMAERLSLLDAASESRWLQKVEYARTRLGAGDWSEVCHQWIMEVLGYMRNRAPMTRLALSHPLDTFADKSVDMLYASESWKLNGLRPANHPRKRLEQYKQLVELRPDWPEHLKAWSDLLLPATQEIDTRSFRREVKMTDLLESLSYDVFAERFASSRLNTICVDAIFPLLAAKGTECGYAYWKHWFPGDMPKALRAFLKRSDLVGRKHPYSNGRLQGALSLSLTRGQLSES